MRSPSILVVLPAVTALAACAVPPDDVAMAQQQAAPEPVADCDDFLCGANSPLIGGLPFWELDADTTPPLVPAPSKLRITKVIDPIGVARRLVVNGAQVTLVAPRLPTLTRERVIGTRLILQGPPLDGMIEDRTFTVTFVSYAEVFYTSGAAGPPIDSYRLSWHEGMVGGPGTGDPNVCPELEADDGVLSGNAILFGGERFEPKTAKIAASDGAAGTWFNVACAGDLRAKLVRIGHYPAAGTTVPEQRQAAIFMFSGRYCGTESYTHLGVPLHWRMFADPTLPLAVDTREAIWSETGAVCLSTPRAVDRDKVACAKDLPLCTPEMFDATWSLSGWLASTFPP